MIYKRSKKNSVSFELTELSFKLGLRCGHFELIEHIGEINTSMSTLRRIFRCMGLYCRKNESNAIEVNQHKQYSQAAIVTF